jgi:hypothetical protein
VLRLEWSGSWRRGAGAEARANFFAGDHGSARANQHRHPVPAGTFMSTRRSCQPMDRFNPWTVRRPHLKGRAKRCQGSLSTYLSVDRSQLISAGESQHRQVLEGSRRMIALLSAAFEAAVALTAGTVRVSTTGGARRLRMPLRSVQTLRAPTREICDPPRERNHSKSHRSGGHP